jgi:CheY-like chemotaxis protein
LNNAPSILVFDEEPMLRAATALLLRNQGAVVTTAASVDEVIAYLERRTFDVVVIDIPERSDACVQALRAMKPRGSIPRRVVICTSDPLGAPVGLAEVLMKPYPFERLLDVVFGASARKRKRPGRAALPSSLSRPLRRAPRYALT